MIERHYSKGTDCARLSKEIVDAGMPVWPDTGARFYGIIETSYPTIDTMIMLYDNITQNEIDSIDAIVAAHIPVPLPDEVKEITIAGTSLDASGKLYTRSESRPLDCTTVFTTCGDTNGGTPNIGAGPRLAWDASVSAGWVDDQNGAPDGMKQFSVIIQFCDSIWLKEGSLYYMNCMKGSYADMTVLCPNGGYYMYLGQVYQNTTGDDLTVDHYLMKHPLQDSVPMGDELNTETCSQELPSYLKFKWTITVPESDATSYGYMELEMYRRRSVVIS